MAELRLPLMPAGSGKGVVHHTGGQMGGKSFDEIEHELTQKSAFAAANMCNAI